MAPVRLCRADLDQVGAVIRRPSSRVLDEGVGIVHIGVGNFHRRHQALYTQRAIELRTGEDNDGGDRRQGWGIVGVGLLPTDADLHARLKQQDMLYSVVERFEEGTAATSKEGGLVWNATVVGSLRDFLLPFRDGQTAEHVLAYLAAETTRVVSMTITEKGYLFDGPKGTLLWDHAMIQADLGALRQWTNNSVQSSSPLPAPCSAIGYIVAGLERRRMAGVAPFTVLSCDNVPKNGEFACRAVLALAERVFGSALVDYIKAQAKFPSTMVDGITPETYARDVEWVRNSCGLDDAAPVMCEMFMDWVIEDNFVEDLRPPWDRVGARMTTDVLPYELTKIRLLNVSHSALTYPAYLLGLHFVHEAVQDDIIGRYTRALMDVEVGPTVPPVPDIDLNEYKSTLIRRFSNAAVKDTLQRVAQDGSTKYANQLIPIVKENLAVGRSVHLLALAVASWAKHLSGLDEGGSPILVTDGRKEELSALMSQEKGIELLVKDKAIFGHLDESTAPAFRELIIRGYESLSEHGTRETYEDALAAVLDSQAC